MEYPKSNLHTHTRFCDGADTPEELVLEAIRQGMTVLGFSGHSYTPFDSGYCMSPEGTTAYREEILRLKRVYADRIRILCGIEQDYYSPKPEQTFEYVIGSVHYLLREGEYLPVDMSLEAIRKQVDHYFEGDVYRYIRCYYETIADVASKTKCQIVGHFDLVEKFNRGGALFDPEDFRYRRPMLDALDALLAREVVFEINTGAIARGRRDVPYPMVYILRRIAERGGRVMINSDTHKKEHLMCAYERAAQLARSCGIGGFVVPTAHGWVTKPLGCR